MNLSDWVGVPTYSNTARAYQTQYSDIKSKMHCRIGDTVMVLYLCEVVDPHYIKLEIFLASSSLNFLRVKGRQRERMAG